MRKGITVILVGILLSLVMPFSIYASTQTVIVPTYSSSSTESTWSSHIHVENYCEGTNASTNSCILKFTVDDNYYGMIAFDGYNGNTMWINYQNVFIAGGYGEYRYNLWQSGQIVINKVNINAVSLVLPDSNVDLTQIIQLLTAIESDTNAIESYTSQTLTQIRSVLSQLIVSNGYLETLTKLRQYNIPIESYGFNLYLINRNYSISEYQNIYSFTYPVFTLNNNNALLQFTVVDNFTIVIYSDKFINNSNLTNYFSFNSDDNNYSYDYEQINLFQNTGRCFKLTFHRTSTTFPVVTIRSLVTQNIVAIYEGTNSNNFSTDFALLYGFNNELLNNLNIIANGTNQSNSASSVLEQNNNQMASDMNSLATIESGYNQDFNSQMQNIDFSNPIANNQGLLPAANFVITVFNGLINNNPLSVLIIVCCILLIGKKVIGK